MKMSPDDPRLTAYALGELDAADRSEFEALLEHDEDLRAEVENIRAAAHLLTEELGCEPMPRLTEAQQARVVSAPQKVEAEKVRDGSSWSHWVMAAGIAALVLTGALAVYLRSNQSSIQMSRNVNNPVVRRGAEPGPTEAPVVSKNPPPEPLRPPESASENAATPVNQQELKPLKIDVPAPVPDKPEKESPKPTPEALVPLKIDTPAPVQTDTPVPAGVPESVKPISPPLVPRKGAMEELKIELPKPMFVGTPKNIKSDNLEPQTGKRREPFMVPAGVVKLSKGMPVTASESEPIIGTLDMIADGDKEGADGSFAEFGPNTQWVQIDLGARKEIFAVVMWHFHSQARVYRDIIVRVSDDPDFVHGVKELFNNDHDNSSGLGVGKDKEYIETNEGRLIDAEGAKGRYVRLYSKGNTSNDMNHYIEVEIYGRPAS